MMVGTVVRGSVARMGRSLFRGRAWKWIPRAPAMANDLAARGRLLPVLVTVVDVLRACPGIGSRGLRAEVRRRRGSCSDAHTEAARVMLAGGVRVSVGPRGDRHYTLDLEQAPPDVREYLAARVAS
jgi:hypothetical protein